MWFVTTSTIPQDSQRFEDSAPLGDRQFRGCVSMSRNHHSLRYSAICCFFQLAANSGGWFRPPRKLFYSFLVVNIWTHSAPRCPCRILRGSALPESVAQHWCYSFRSYQLTRQLPLIVVSPAETVMIAHLHVFSNTRFRDGRWSNAATRIISTTNFLPTSLIPYSYYCYIFIVYWSPVENRRDLYSRKSVFFGLLEKTAPTNFLIFL